MNKKSVILFSVLLLFCVFIIGEIIVVDATDDVLDVLEVSSSGTSVVSNIALQDEVSYEIVVSGVYYTGGTPIINYAHDAMYATQNNWVAHTNDQSGLYIDQWAVGSKQWGTYNADHIYRHTIVGNGSKISFRIYDTSYSDNRGSLNIQILGSPTTPQAPTPTPTSTTPDNTPTSTTPTQNTPTSPSTSPTQPDDPSSTAPTPPTTQTNTTPIATEQTEPFGNTFVIVTALVVTVTVTTILIFTLRKTSKT